MKLFQAPDMIAPYPVPSFDSGIGMHDAVDAYCRPEDRGLFGAQPPLYREFCEELTRRAVWWFKLFVANQNKVEFAHALVLWGIMPIVRFWEERIHPLWRVPQEDVEAHIEVGVEYFEFGNEPNLKDEAKGADALGWDFPPDWIEQVNDQWVANTNTMLNAAEAVRQRRIQAGDLRPVRAISLYPSLAPGGNYQHIDFYLRAFEDLKARHNDWFIERAQRGEIAFAVHPRPLNHPLDYPNDPINLTEKGTGYIPLTADSTGHSMYQLVIDLCRVTFGFVLPTLATEAGLSIGDHQDGRYPRTDVEIHTQGNLTLFRGFREGRWHPAHLCECYWTLFESGRWINDALIANQGTMQGGNLPLWDEMLQQEHGERPALNIYTEKPKEPIEEEQEPMPNLSVEYSDLYAQWVADGGAENNFRKHLLGVGVIKPTAADLKFLADEMNASADQLRGALSNYPF